jgi:meiotically up-regulated gene 157 (Mug157) protein
MAVVMQLLTSDDDEEITHGLKELLGSTSNLGLMHETVNSHDDSQWTRPWYVINRFPDILKFY